MKKVLVLAGAILCGFSIAAPSFGTGNSVQIAVSQYRTLAYLPRAKLEKCTRRLRSVLRAQAAAGAKGSPKAVLAKVDQSMHQAGCLDRYSSLVDRGDPDQSAAGTSVRIEGDYLIMRIASFNDKATDAIDQDFDRLDEDARNRVQSVVLDLRGNLGGHIDSLAELLDRYFAPRPKLRYLRIVATDYPRFHMTDRKGHLAGLPIEILVDGNTASASEWMVATLRFSWYPKKTRVIGEKTYGKAIIQCVRPKDGVYIKVTCGEWDTRGRKVNGVGITPDVPMKLESCGTNDKCLLQKIGAVRLSAR